MVCREEGIDGAGGIGQGLDSGGDGFSLLIRFCGGGIVIGEDTSTLIVGSGCVNSSWESKQSIQLRVASGPEDVKRAPTYA